MVNPAYEHFIGEERDVVGKALFEALPEVRGQGFEKTHRHVRETGEPVVIRGLRVMIGRTPGAPLEERFMDVTYLPLLEADGTHDAVIAHGADVTEHVRARRAAEESLAATERARAEAETAQSELAEANAQLQDQALELRGGQLSIERTRVSMADTVATLDAMLRAQMDAHRIEFVCAPCDPALAAEGDRHRIVQICVNLLTNAVRATPPGGRVTLACAPEEGSVAISVADTGSGIPGEQLERIFSPFTQLGRALNAPREGAGLGLAISRGLAEAMGGALTVTSEPGAGSIFTLRLPRAGG